MLLKNIHLNNRDVNKGDKLKCVELKTATVYTILFITRLDYNNNVYSFK